MKGTEKQIKWAEDIVANATAAIEWARENPSDEGKANIEMWNKGIDLVLSKLNSIDHAGKIIDMFYGYKLNRSDMGANFMNVLSVINRNCK